MSKFTKKMTIVLLVFCGAFYLFSDVILKMILSAKEINNDTSVIPIYAVHIVLGLLSVGLILLVTIKFTRFFRIHGLSSFPVDEFAFYRNFMLIFSAVPIIYAVYSYHFAVPFYNDALKEAIHKVYIQQYAENYYKQLCGTLTDVHDKCLMAEKAAAVIQCVLQAVILFLATPYLVKIYQTPAKKRLDRK